MSVLDQIKELEAQKQQLLKSAKAEALANAEAAVKELNELGFNYQLIEANAPKTTRSRKSGVRDNVLAEIKKHQNGIARGDLLSAMGAYDGRSQQSISNAVAALKKNNQITADNGHYTAV